MRGTISAAIRRPRARDAVGDVIDRTVEIAQGVGNQHFADVGFDAILRQVNRIDLSYRA